MNIFLKNNVICSSRPEFSPIWIVYSGLVKECLSFYLCFKGRQSTSTSEYSVISTFGTPGTGEYSVISAFGTPGTHEYSVISSFGTPGTESFIAAGARESLAEYQ